MIDIATIERETPAAIEAGHRIFQTHKFADTDEAQVDYLLQIIDPPQDAMVLDAGCGIGEVSRLMSVRRPDMSFVLMNLSMQQLSLCPVGEQYLHALDDCQESMLSTSSMDCAMYSSALCQMDAEVALKEAYRVLKDGGVLLINDLIHDGKQVDLSGIGVYTMDAKQISDVITKAGFIITNSVLPESNSSHFRALAEDAQVDVSMVSPIIIRAVAQKECENGI